MAEPWLNFTLILSQLAILAVKAGLHMKRVIAQNNVPSGGAIRDAGGRYVALYMTETGRLDMHI